MLYRKSPGYSHSVLRNRYFFVADILLVSLAAAASFYLRLDAGQIIPYLPTLAVVTVVSAVVKPLVFFFFGLYRRYWRYASVDDMLTIAVAASIASLITALIEILVVPLRVHVLSVPRSIPIIDWLLTLMLVGGVRFSVRLLLRRSGVRYARPSEAQRVLVMGAGDAGAMIVREMRNNTSLNMLPVGFVDDNVAKSGMTIHGVSVLGTRQDIPALVESKAIDEVIIAMPTASGIDIRAVISACQAIGVPYKTIPGVFELISGQVSVNQIRDVRVEDLLRREPV